MGTWVIGGDMGGLQRQAGEKTPSLHRLGGGVTTGNLYTLSGTESLRLFAGLDIERCINALFVQNSIKISYL
jgi:hypothetical protein